MMAGAGLLVSRSPLEVVRQEVDHLTGKIPEHLRDFLMFPL